MIDGFFDRWQYARQHVDYKIDRAEIARVLNLPDVLLVSYRLYDHLLA